jgi:hypothetical protein
MISMNSGMYFHTLGTQKFQARSLGAEIGDGFFAMLIARNVIIEVCFHILDGKGRFHDCLY